LIDLASRQKFFAIHYVPAAKRKVWAAQAFDDLGPTAKNAVPGLIEVYERGPDPLSREVAAQALGSIRADASPAIPSLIRGATNMNEDPVVRSQSIFTLGLIRREPARVVPVLTHFAMEPSAEFRNVAIIGIRRFGPDARSALPELIKLLNIQGTYSRVPIE